MKPRFTFFDGGQQKRNADSDDISAIASALNSDIVAVISPSTKTTAHASAVNRTVTVQLQDSNGLVHSWCNKAISTIVTASKSSASGTATVASSTITFVNGVATIPVTIGGTWAAADTDTVTIATMTVNGVSVAGGTSVETMS